MRRKVKHNKLSSVGMAYYKTPEFETFVQAKIKEYKVPGLSFAAVQGDEIYAKVTMP
jgi:hypothetical protein